MSGDRKSTLFNSDQFAVIDGITGGLDLSINAAPLKNEYVSFNAPDRPRGAYLSPTFSDKSDWCRTAFFLHQQGHRSEPTDWGFVTPVWIAAALFCVLIQILLVQSTATLFG
ncbi:MAG: hypothetical protein AAFP81_15685 [Pseudomonadota bacterium]